MKNLAFLVVSTFISINLLAQNVGIGTNTPVRQLHVHGGTSVITAINMSNNVSGQNLSDGMRIGFVMEEGGSNNYGFINVAENLPLYFATNNLLWAAFSPAGNLGIGTLTPTLAKLQVVGKEGHTMLLTRASASGIGASFTSPLNDRINLEFNSYYAAGASQRLTTGYVGRINFNSATGNLVLQNSVESADANTIPSFFTAGFTILGGTNYVHSPSYSSFGLVLPHPDSGRVMISHNSSPTSPTLQLVETSTTDYARIEFANQANNRTWQIAGNQSTSGVSLDRLNFYHSSAGNLMTMVGNGKIGIGNVPEVGDGKLLIDYNSSTFDAHVKLRENNLGDYSRLELTNTGASRVWHIAGQVVSGSGSTNRENDILNIWNSSRGDIMTFRGDGRVGILTTNPPVGYALSVAGRILCTELRVQLTGSWPDYVFSDSYQLKPLSQVEEFINIHKHLPGIPAASHVEKQGLDVGEMQKKMMEKIEELTLYIIQQQKEIDQLKEKIKD